MFNDNKENIIFSPSAVQENANGRRPRSRTNNIPASVLATQDVSINSPGWLGQPSRTCTPRLPNDDEDLEITEPMAIYDPSTSLTVRLPRYLRRPNFKEISPEVLEAVDPGLKDVAIEYILTHLQTVGKQMFAVAVTTTAHPPRNRLPRELEVVVTDFSAEAPTHLFAVYSRAAPRIAIHPAHGIVLATHCAHLAPLPHSTSKQQTEAWPRLILPVVPLCVPNPATFPLLLRYLYTKQLENVLASLVPIRPGDTAQSVEELSETLAATLTLQTLLSHAARVHGLWSNVASLGVFDLKLSRGLEMIWEVLMDALTISTGSS